MRRSYGGVGPMVDGGFVCKGMTWEARRSELAKGQRWRSAVRCVSNLGALAPFFSNLNSKICDRCCGSILVAKCLINTFFIDFEKLTM